MNLGLLDVNVLLVQSYNNIENSKLSLNFLFCRQPLNCGWTLSSITFTLCILWSSFWNRFRRSFKVLEFLSPKRVATVSTEQYLVVFLLKESWCVLSVCVYMYMYVSIMQIHLIIYFVCCA